MPDDADDIEPADAYRLPDGTREIVFAVDEGHVLTVREYSSRASFEESVADATYEGTHEGIAALPPVEWFEDEDRDP